MNYIFKQKIQRSNIHQDDISLLIILGFVWFVVFLIKMCFLIISVSATTV